MAATQTEIPAYLQPGEGVQKWNTMGRWAAIHPQRPWAQCRVVDDDGNDVATDCPGECG